MTTLTLKENYTTTKTDAELMSDFFYNEFEKEKVIIPGRMFNEMQLIKLNEAAMNCIK